MGQILLQDKIGALTHSGGTITMAASASNPARLTVGGQQYRFTSNQSLSVGTATANTLYMIYMVLSGGVPTLIKDTAVNSIGPSGGYLSWKLVGAFYAAAANTWGSFVNIEGSPTSDWISFTATLTASTPPTKGTVIRDEARFQRIGGTMRIVWNYEQNGAGSAGTGAYRLVVPGSLTMDSTKTSFATNADMAVGNGYINEINTDGLAQYNYPMVVTPYDASGLGFVFHAQSANNLRVERQQASGADGNSNFSIANLHYHITNCQIPISQWSSIPLKDL